METVVKQVAKAHGCSAAISSPKPLYNVTRNHEGFYADVVEPVIKPDRYKRLDLPIMGSEDFGAVLAQVPGAYVFLGACPEDNHPDEAANVHDPNVLFLAKKLLSTEYNFF